MATHSGILAWKKIPWTEDPGVHGGLKESDMTEKLSIHACLVKFNTHSHLVYVIT